MSDFKPEKPSAQKQTPDKRLAALAKEMPAPKQAFNSTNPPVSPQSAHVKFSTPMIEILTVSKQSPIDEQTRISKPIVVKKEPSSVSKQSPIDEQTRISEPIVVKKEPSSVSKQPCVVELSVPNQIHEHFDLLKKPVSNKPPNEKQFPVLKQLLVVAPSASNKFCGFDTPPVSKLFRAIKPAPASNSPHNFGTSVLMQPDSAEPPVSKHPCDIKYPVSTQPCVLKRFISKQTCVFEPSPASKKPYISKHLRAIKPAPIPKKPYSFEPSVSKQPCDLPSIFKQNTVFEPSPFLKQPAVSNHPSTIQSSPVSKLHPTVEMPSVSNQLLESEATTVFKDWSSFEQSAVSNQLDQSQSYKPYQGTLLTQGLYNLFIEYLKSDRNRAPEAKHLTDLIGTFQDGAKQDRRALQCKFKSWSRRMELRNHNGNYYLVLWLMDKIIIPKESFDTIISKLHKAEEGIHLDVGAVVDEVKKVYSWGRRDFGMDWETVALCIAKCKNPPCVMNVKKRFPHLYLSEDINMILSNIEKKACEMTSVPITLHGTSGQPSVSKPKSERYHPYASYPQTTSEFQKMRPKPYAQPRSSTNPYGSFTAVDAARWEHFMDNQSVAAYNNAVYLQQKEKYKKELEIYRKQTKEAIERKSAMEKEFVELYENLIQSIAEAKRHINPMLVGKRSTFSAQFKNYLEHCMYTVRELQHRIDSIPDIPFPPKKPHRRSFSKNFKHQNNLMSA